MYWPYNGATFRSAYILSCIWILKPWVQEPRNSKCFNITFVLCLYSFFYYKFYRFPFCQQLQKFQQKRTPANSPVPTKSKRTDTPNPAPSTPQTNRQPRTQPGPSQPRVPHQGGHSNPSASESPPHRSPHQQNTHTRNSDRPSPVNRVRISKQTKTNFKKCIKIWP